MVIINGQDATVKRHKKTENGLMLISTNPLFDPLFYSIDDIEKLSVSIIGKVIELRAKFN